MNKQVIEDGAQPTKTEQSGPEAQISGTTEFIDGMPTSELIHMEEKPVEVELYKSQPFDNTYLQEWFSRPVRISNGVLAPTDVANTFTPITHPTTALYDDVYRKKWTGYAYWRGTVVYTLQVNASPFQAGIYALSYLPVCGAHQSWYNKWVNAHYDTLLLRSQLPHVLLDLSHDTKAVLRVPYASAYDKVALDQPAGSIRDYFAIGDVNLWPLSPLNVGAGQDATVGYTIWAHMEDVHLEIPVCPQSGYAPKKKSKMPADIERDTKNIGPVTSTLTHLGGAAKSLAKIPILTEMAAPAAWALDIMSGVSSAFGWSKPTNLDVQTRMQKDLMFGMQHVDGSDNSKTMALFQNNTVEVLPGFAGTDCDEMTIDSVVTRPFVQNKTTWATTTASNTLLTSFTVDPFHAVSTTRDGLGVIYYSPMAFLAGYFQYWRGDICFTIQLAKTNMHSGRLEITFTPYNSYNTPTTASPQARSYEWREVIDIREESKFSFRIPFHHFRSYRPCNANVEFARCGIVRVYVLDELVAPSTAPLTIDMFTWMHAAPGFEFAVPRANPQLPVYGLTPVYTQSGMLDVVKSAYSTIIGNAKPNDDFDNHHARKCIGERVTSLRQLCRVTRFMMNLLPDDAPTSKVIGIHPYVFPAINRTAGVTTLPTHGGDFISALGSCYALNRGGVRVKTISDTGGLVIQSLRCRYLGTAQPAFYEDTAVGYNGNYGSIVDAVAAVSSVSDRGGTETAIPAYGPCHSRATADCMFDPVTGITTNRSLPPIFLETMSSEPRILRVARGGADDYNFGLFVSVPPMWIGPTAT